MQLSLCGAGIGEPGQAEPAGVCGACRDALATQESTLESAAPSVLPRSWEAPRHSMRNFSHSGVARRRPFGLEVEWRKDDTAFESGMATLAEKAAIAQQLGCGRCCTWMPSSTSDESGEWRAAHRGTLSGDWEGLCGLWGSLWPGVGRAASPTGGWREPDGPQPDDLDPAPDSGAIAETGQSNIGLLVDSYHCYTTGVTEDTLAALTDSQIVHVHINDAPKGVGPAGAKDGQRVVPGDGRDQLTELLKRPEACGLRWLYRL